MIDRSLKWYEGKKIIITGASGYIASSICEKLYSKADLIIRLSRKNLKPKQNCEDSKDDISLIETWKKLLPEVDVIFHLASQTSIYRSAHDTQEDFNANVKPMNSILGACKDYNFSPFIIFAGSATQVGITKVNPVNENNIDLPITFYDLHKLISEKLLEGYSNQGIVKGTTLRLPNIYGPGEKSSSSDRGVINQMVKKALNKETLTVYGKGDQLRDYLYIDDLVDALLRSAQHQDKVNKQHFILGTGRGISISEAFKIIASKVSKTIDKKVNIISIKEPKDLSKIESRSFIANSNLYQSLTNWSPTIEFDTGIDKTIEFFNKRN